MFVHILILTSILMVQLSVALLNDGNTTTDWIQYHNNAFIPQDWHIPQLKAGKSSPCPHNPVCSCTKLTKHRLKVDCSSTKMRTIPENFPTGTTTLILAKNFISEIPDKVFERYSKMTVLDLSNNEISELGSDTFTGLQRLQYLHLEMNKLRYTDTAIQNDTFGPLKQLKSLNIQQNLREFWENESYPIQALTLLPNLTTLSMDGMENQTSELGLVSNELLLKTLDLTGRYRGNIGVIKEDMFDYLPALEVLVLRNCSIHCVQNGSFMELSHLKKLDLSLNEKLEFKSMSNITYGLQFTEIEWLNLNNIHQILGECTKITAENLKYINNTSVKYIFIDSNRLETMDIEAVQYIPTSLESISVKHNRLAIGNFVNRLIIFVMGKHFDNLTTLSIASQRLPDPFTALLKNTHFMQKLYPKVNRKSKRSLFDLNQTQEKQTGKMDLFDNPEKRKSSSDGNWQNSTTDFTPTLDNEDRLLQQYLEDMCGYCPGSSIKIPVPSNLKYLDMHEMTIRIELEQFCLCKNKIETLLCNKNMIWNWKGKLLGLNKLKTLSLANNACSKISYNFFDNMTSLVKLNISKNFLGFSLSRDYNGLTFKKLANLKKLYLSYNRIKQLPYNFFQGLTGLRKLNLTGNQIANVDWNMEHMVNLSYIDLADNYIADIDKTVLQFWDRQATKKNFTLNLDRNYFKCTCKNLDLIKWFSETNVRLTAFEAYTCKFDNGSVGNLTFASEIYSSLQRECASYMIIILVTTTVVLTGIIFIVAAIVYRYRWNLRYLYYSAKFRLTGYIPVSQNEGEFEHDAFVSYASEDGTFIRQHLVPELESNRGLNLLVHDRDFVAGNFVSDNIMRAITTCRKTLIIMSPHYIHSRWCCYEMNMARMEAIKTDRDVICVLMKEPVQTSGLPLEVLDTIQKQTYMEYPKGNQQLVQQFWDRAADALRQK